MEKKPRVLFSYAFRPFFLLNGIFAVFIVLVWVLTLHGGGPPGVTPLWHAHEMLVGFALATVAGFSLTAVANWTSRPALAGMPLAWLVGCWLAGRLGMLMAGVIPVGLVAVLDMLFPLSLAVLLGKEIISGGSRRNYILVFIIALLAGFNALYHLGASHLLFSADRLAVYLLMHTVLLLVTIIAGRIVPSFTGNWLRMQGQKRMPHGNDSLDRLLLVLVVTTGIAGSAYPQSATTGTLALATAVTHGIRLSRWRGLATLSNPLLFVLHAAYAWLPIGYALMGLAALDWLPVPVAALHALTMGAIGSMVLAVTTRVALGHTGRPLRAARATVVAYVVFALAVLIRVLGPLLGTDTLHMIDTAATGWALSFAIFTWVYWPILTRPRK